MGPPPVSPANGQIVIDDAVLGNITVTVKVAETVSAPLGVYYYDVKGLAAGGVADIKTAAVFVVTPDITRSITVPA